VKGLIRTLIALLVIAATTPIFGGDRTDQILIEGNVHIAARIGETDRPIEILRHLLTVPDGLPPITPALLRLDPVWDPIRSDPRLQELAATPLKS
jgi:hypothetical protein